MILPSFELTIIYMLIDCTVTKIKVFCKAYTSGIWKALVKYSFFCLETDKAINHESLCCAQRRRL